MNKRVLITGSNGQLGNELRELAEQCKDHTFFFHDVDTLDITNYMALLSFCEAQKPDIIINGAAYTNVDKAETEKEAAYLINATGVENLTNAARKTQAKFIHISTDFVFDGKKNIPYTESDIPNPRGIYAQSKREGEIRALKYENSMIIRTSWLYSGYGHNFVKTIRKYGKERDELRVVYDQTGTPTYAGDLAKALLQIIGHIAENKTAYKPGIFHFSNEGVCSWYDFAYEIICLSGISCRVAPIETKEYPLPAPRPAFSVLNKNKIKHNFQLNIPYWKESLKQCLQKIEQNDE